MRTLAVVFWLVVVAIPGFVVSQLITRNLAGVRVLAA
jgi:hypothetical protein